METILMGGRRLWPSVQGSLFSPLSFSQPSPVRADRVDRADVAWCLIAGAQTVLVGRSMAATRYALPR